MIGLQYYNTAINAYNHNNLSLSLYCLNEAFKFNKSERIAELLILIINSVDNPPAIEKVISNFYELSGLIASN